MSRRVAEIGLKMEGNLHYQFYLRPGYGSTQLLIEIFKGAERDEFLAELMDAIQAIHSQWSAQHDLWMNDEMLVEMGTDLGVFQLSVDIWDLAFLMAADNQAVLLRIDALLQADARFEKVEVDFERYRLDK